MTNGSTDARGDGSPRRKGSKGAAERARQREALAWTVAAIVLIVAVVAMVWISSDGGGSEGASSGANPDVAAAGQVQVDGAPRSSPLAQGEPVPGFTAPELNGGTVQWAEYQGSPTVLSVWAPWCPHCQVELPVLARTLADYPDVNLVTIVTAVGAQPGPTPKEYMQDNGLEFPVALDDASGTLAQAFGIQGFPTIYLVNSDGTVAVEAEGEVAEQDLRAMLDQLT